MSFSNNIFAAAQTNVQVDAVSPESHCGGCYGCSGCAHFAEV